MMRRSVTFSVWLERLTRHVCLPDGRALVHECTLGVFERVVVYLDDHADKRITTLALRHALTGVPCAEVDVALDFLARAGLVVRRGCTLSACVPDLYEAAMTSFSHLAESGG
ncbi:MAG TPA: hypothetical protein VKU02_03305 [Gemmataceae bacterium]|nr:hypothetical protein [Gemmataceae bacterium]